jgi:hypothetical protein
VRPVSLSATDTYGEELRREVEETWPELTRFYGVTPNELATLPKWIRFAYIKSLPKLHAREQLDRVIAAGMPHMDKAARKSLIRDLFRQAEFRQAEPQKATSHESIEAFGIPVTVVDKDGKEIGA